MDDRTAPLGKGGGRCRLLGVVALWVAVLAASLWGCGQPATEDDLMRARSVVQRTIGASSYEEFMEGFTKARQARMEDTAIWIRWWQEKLEKGKPIWMISSVRDAGRGMIEVTVQHRRRPTSRQYYRLVRDGRTWGITEVESER